MSKLKRRLVQGHTVSKGWPPIPNLNYLDLESMLQTTILLATKVALRGLDHHLSSDVLLWPHGRFFSWLRHFPLLDAAVSHVMLMTLLKPWFDYCGTLFLDFSVNGLRASSGQAIANTHSSHSLIIGSQVSPQVAHCPSHQMLWHQL